MEGTLYLLLNPGQKLMDYVAVWEKVYQSTWISACRFLISQYLLRTYWYLQTKRNTRMTSPQHVLWQQGVGRPDPGWIQWINEWRPRSTSLGKHDHFDAFHSHNKLRGKFLITIIQKKKWGWESSKWLKRMLKVLFKYQTLPGLLIHTEELPPG